MAFGNVTPEERKAALAKALEVRQARSELKHQLAEGTLSFEQLYNFAQVDGNPAAGVRVFDALKSLPRLGTVSARKLMTMVGVIEKRKMGGLSQGQFNELNSRLV